MNKAWRRQSSAEWASRAATDLCEKNQAWTTGWHRLRAGSNAEFRDAVTEAAALHALSVGSVCAPDKATLKAEAHALQF